MSEKPSAAKAPRKALDPRNRKAEFILVLADYLVGDQAHKSILLEMGKPEAVAWAKLRGTTPLFGYPTMEEAVNTLTEFLR